MSKRLFLQYFIFSLINIFSSVIVLAQNVQLQNYHTDITPNNFTGTDIQRIRAAIASAKGTTNKIVIPKRNLNPFWIGYTYPYIITSEHIIAA